MESRHDSENAEKILYKMRPTELVGEQGRAHTRARTGVVVTLRAGCRSGGRHEGGVHSGPGERGG